MQIFRFWRCFWPHYDKGNGNANISIHPFPSLHSRTLSLSDNSAQFTAAAAKTLFGDPPQTMSTPRLGERTVLLREAVPKVEIERVPKPQNEWRGPTWRVLCVATPRRRMDGWIRSDKKQAAHARTVGPPGSRPSLLRVGGQNIDS